MTAREIKNAVRERLNGTGPAISDTTIYRAISVACDRVLDRGINAPENADWSEAIIRETITQLRETP